MNNEQIKSDRLHLLIINFQTQIFLSAVPNTAPVVLVMRLSSHMLQHKCQTESSTPDSSETFVMQTAQTGSCYSPTNTLEPHYNTHFGVHSDISVITEQSYSEWGSISRGAVL